ncbi:MAG: ATP-dependent helicase [Nanoarchaeota archaeon]|nr:ATP-dependent helicase [Nanoarchaeota archaeon]MBU1623076.1 ATP-dependent helicase [Nanoarchaeota archaeon]
MEDIKPTEQQQKAIEFIDSPLLIVAGPGTGKTRVLTEKVLYLVNKGYNPNRILVSTFTIKSAEELKDRLRKKLGDTVENMQISTIHSFCQKMLQSFPEYHNFGNVFGVLDDLDQFIYVNKHYWNYGLKDYVKDIDVEELINFYNKCTENDVDPAELVKHCKRNNEKEMDIAIAKSYQIYLGNLLNPNDTKLDFALLQREFYHLLLNNPKVLEIVRDMYDYILIDEYQDTNPIQDAIFKLISEPKYKITVVGDEDQSIYGFRGASIKNFRTFLERYPQAKKLELEENFRSNKEIVDCFDSFMKPFRTFEKKIFTNNPNFSKPLTLNSSTSEEEGKNIVEWIKNLVKNNNVKYEDIAILFKSVKFHSAEIIDELEKNEIPFITTGDSSLLTQDEVIDMLVLMLYVNSYEPNDYQKEWLFQNNILESEFLELSKDTIEKLSKDIDIYKLLDSFDYDKLEKLKIGKEDIDKLIALKNLKKQQTRNGVSQLRLFYKVLDATKYHYRLFKKYTEEKDGESDIKIRNLAKFSDLLFKFEDNTNSKEYKTLLYHLGRIPESKMEDSASFEDIDAVKLMTIHQAKGLEFPIVILAGVTNRRYNSKTQEDAFIIDIPKELMLDQNEFDRGAELRRTFYVGMSRAQKILAISTIDGKGSKPSEFIDNIGSSHLMPYKDFNKQFNEDDHYEPIKEKTKISYSSVSAYIDCPFRFFCRDYLGFQTPTDYYQAYGVIVHNSLKKLHILIKEGKEITIQNIIEIVDLFCKDDDSRKKWRDELITDLWNYYEKTSNFIQEVLDVELPFSYISSDLIVNGQVDLVIRNKNNDIEIIDYKSRYKEGLSKMNVDLQLRLYNIALQNKYKDTIKKVSAYTFKDNTQTDFTNTETDLEETKKTVSGISESIDKKEFRRNWMGPSCETKTGKCEFYQICKKLEEDNQNGKQ